MHAHQSPDGSGIRGAAWGAAGGLCGWGELCRGMHTSQMVHKYTHCLQYCQHKEDSALFSHQLPPVPPLSLVSAHSSSQVVHCRVFPPLPLHAPVLVLHLAVYSASPTQGRVGLTDRLTHMQCTDTVQCEQLSKVAPNEWVPTMVLLLTTPIYLSLGHLQRRTLDPLEWGSLTG